MTYLLLLNKVLKVLLALGWAMPFIVMIVRSIYGYEYNPNIISNRILLAISFCISVYYIISWGFVLINKYSISRVLKAIRNKDFKSFQFHLSRLSTNSMNHSSSSLLKVAIDLDAEADYVMLLLLKGSIIEEISTQYYNISYTLHYIISYYKYIHSDMIKILMDKGAYLDFVDTSRGFNGLSILQSAVLRGNTECIEFLLKQSINTNYFITDINLNTLMLAARYSKDPEVIELLLSYGDDIHKINKDGYNSLLLAAQYNPNPEIIEILFRYGASIDSYSIKGDVLKINEVTPLRLAVMSNNIEVVRKLIDLGDNVNYKDLYGLSILFVAATHNTDLDVIKLLINKGANITSDYDNEGNTPLMGAAYLNSNIQIIRYLMLQCSQQLAAKNKDGLSFIDYLYENKSLTNEEKDMIINKWDIN